MPVKFWSRAGLMLTAWCNARCASCYLCCGPQVQERMPVDDALRWWGQLIDASPHGCRVHITGGEPFEDFDRLLEVCTRARQAGLGPLEKIETNAFWATDRGRARDWLGLLNAAGLGKLSISADPYHQQFVPIARARLAAEAAEEVLGPDRVQVRWADWLAEGSDTHDWDEEKRRIVFHAYAGAGRDRIHGRAAEGLAAAAGLKPLAAMVDNPCSEALLRCRHVHVEPQGHLTAGTCGGIVLGQLSPGRTTADLWRLLDGDHADRSIVGRLAAGGPCNLLDEARDLGMVPCEAYASKCQLCWQIRRCLWEAGLHRDELAPAWIYDSALREFGSILPAAAT